MSSLQYVIQDEAHSETMGEAHTTLAAAREELERLRGIAWNQAPNQAPCTSWVTCGREYVLISYDTTTTPWRELSRTPALTVSSQAVAWLFD